MVFVAAGVFEPHCPELELDPIIKFFKKLIPGHSGIFATLLSFRIAVGNRPPTHTVKGAQDLIGEYS